MKTVVTINDRALGSVREQFRVITIFHDFDHWNYNAQKTETLKDHAHYSLAYDTRAGAEQSATGMQRLHGEAAVKANPRTPTIKRQVIERRLISDWEQA